MIGIDDIARSALARHSTAVATYDLACALIENGNPGPIYWQVPK